MGRAAEDDRLEAPISLTLQLFEGGFWVLMRCWTSQVEVERAGAYEDFAANVSLPMFRAHRGLFAVVMARTGADASVVTFWQDQACVRELERSPLYLRTVLELGSARLLRGEQRTTVKQVHLAEWPKTFPWGPAR